MSKLPLLRRYIGFSILAILLVLSIGGCKSTQVEFHSGEKLVFTKPWKTIKPQGQPTKRHEAAFIEYKGQLYLLGGRRINPVDKYDPASNSWTELSKPPIQLHHFQAVTYKDAIYIIGAFTDGYPGETSVDRVIKYYPEQDRFEYSHEIPESRRRGAAGAVVYQDKIYLVGGSNNGHIGGFQPWFDEYDPRTGEWRELPDAPRARDHFQAVVIDHQLYAVAGRRTSQGTNQIFNQTVPEVDVFDFVTHTWSTLPITANIPTERAGNMASAWDKKLMVAGGESGSQQLAHNEVELFDPVTRTWQTMPPMVEGRHGSGLAIFGGSVYTASGCAMRGGNPELHSIERLALPPSQVDSARTLVQKHHTITLNFDGPETSELSNINPFTDYRLQVDFTHRKSNYSIRGFYAADGNAAHTGADSGSIWQVRFAPEMAGEWTYKARLYKGSNVALRDDLSTAETYPLANSTGKFNVIESFKASPDYKSQGRLVADGNQLKIKEERQSSPTFLIKGGANSPENLLAFEDFDGTYRVSSSKKDGEAKVNIQLHRFAPHAQDWQAGDPTWQGGKGKNIIGAINYLASTGMNSVYFLSMNINGDGKDVWPYVDHETFDRFDVSKLEQWEVLFQHMQSKGIILHVVLQETENETLLDGGDTGSMRQLYFHELIARFAHHPALIWNLGEENGPVEWSPIGQNDQQRMDMANFFEQADPYAHPVLLHTHSTPHEKDKILTPQLGLQSLDGLSFQVDEREKVNSETAKWLQLSDQAGKKWLITMDEIGKWMDGALNDADDPDHDSLRRHALWGSLLAGSAGVEWYFGAHHPHNDLNSEDWRARHNLWVQTKYAMDFFQAYLPFWEMQSANEHASNKQVYVFAKSNDIYALYIPKDETTNLTVSDGIMPEGTRYKVAWFDPKSGGDLQQERIVSVSDSGKIALDRMPSKDRDWVALVEKLK